MLNNKKSQGFTLLEVIVAIFLITVGVGGSLALINQTLSAAQILPQKLIASYLAQEGIEIAKNIRDSNLLKIRQGLEGVNWDSGLTGCASGCEADFNDPALSPNDRYLKIGNGFYNYDSGQDVIFKRKMTITPEGVDILKVLVEVSWQERGRTHKVKAQANLYKWWQ